MLSHQTDLLTHSPQLESRYASARELPAVELLGTHKIVCLEALLKGWPRHPAVSLVSSWPARQGACPPQGPFSPITLSS